MLCFSFEKKYEPIKRGFFSNIFSAIHDTLKEPIKTLDFSQEVNDIRTKIFNPKQILDYCPCNPFKDDLDVVNFSGHLLNNILPLLDYLKKTQSLLNIKRNINMAKQIHPQNNKQLILKDMIYLTTQLEKLYIQETIDQNIETIKQGLENLNILNEENNIKFLKFDITQ